MYLFDSHDTLFEELHGGKYYTLCNRMNAVHLFEHVTLTKIPTRAQAEIILATLHFPDTPLVRTPELEEIPFADEKGVEGLTMPDTCPHCGASMSRYWHRLSKGLVQTLVKFKMAVIEKQENKIHVPKEVVLTKNEYNNFQKLRYHALVAKSRNAKGDHDSGYWVLTRRGNEFLKGLITVPEKVQTFRNKITDRSTNRVSVHDVMREDAKVWDEKHDFLDNLPEPDIDIAPKNDEDGNPILF